MAKNKTVHLVPENKFPVTCCGVDIVVKEGADWVMDNEEGYLGKITCVNCVKVLAKGSVKKNTSDRTSVMKAPSSVSAEDHARMAIDDHMSRINRLQSKISGAKLDAESLIMAAFNEDETKELKQVVGYLEAAQHAVGFAITSIGIMVKETAAKEDET